MPSSSGSQMNGNLEGECQATDLAPSSPDKELQDTLGLLWQLWEGYRARKVGPVKISRSLWGNWSELASGLLPRVLWVPSLTLSPTVPCIFRI